MKRPLLTLGLDATAPAPRHNPRRLLKVGLDATAPADAPATRPNPSPAMQPEDRKMLGWIS